MYLRISEVDHRLISDDFNDERMDPSKNPAPFDGKRLIYGGFMPSVEL